VHYLIIILTLVLELPKRHRHFLKEKEAKKFLLEVTKTVGTDIGQLLGAKTAVEVEEMEISDIFFFDDRPLLSVSNGMIFPTLYFKELFAVMPKIVVDMGAIPYVCKGADVMAPGVVAIKGEFKENNLLLIVDERHGKPLAVGIALFGSEEMKALNNGKIVKNLHYVGDKLWNYLKAC
jgi:PUA-domain protein